MERKMKAVLKYPGAKTDSHRGFATTYHYIEIMWNRSSGAELCFLTKSQHI